MVTPHVNPYSIASYSGTFSLCDNRDNPHLFKHFKFGIVIPFTLRSSNLAMGNPQIKFFFDRKIIEMVLVDFLASHIWAPPAKVFVGVVMLNFSAPRVDKESVADAPWQVGGGNRTHWNSTFRRA